MADKVDETSTEAANIVSKVGVKKWKHEINKMLEFATLTDITYERSNFKLQFDSGITLTFYRPKKINHRIGKSNFFLKEEETDYEKELWVAKSYSALNYNVVEKIEINNDIISIEFYFSGDAQTLIFEQPDGALIKI